MTFRLSLSRDRRGAVAPMIAVLGASLIGATGFALDTGLYIVGNRDLRAATEAAALAAAMNPAQATARARASLSRNGYDPSVLRSVQLGRYCPDARLSSVQRFDPGLTRCPGDGRVNAVRVQTGKPSRRYLTRVLGAADPIPDLAATATAARIDEAGVGITSGILTVTNSLVTSVNDLLGALLGIKLQLNAADIQTMMSGTVDAGRFFDALAARVGESGSYQDLTSRTVGLQDLLLAAAAAADQPATAATLTLVAGQVSNSYTVPLAGLFGLGVWKNMPVGESNAQPGLRAGLNAYQLLTYAAQAKGASSLDLSSLTGAAFPGSTVKLTIIGSTPTNRPRFSFGPAGETGVSTSVSRLQLKVRLVDTGISSGLLGLLKLLGVSIDLASDIPVLISIGDSNATIKEIRCAQTGEQARDAQVDVAVSPALISAYVGEVRADAVNSTMPYIDPAAVTPVTILNAKLFGIPLTSITAKAVALPVTGGDTSVTFGPRGSGNPQIGTPGSAQSAEITGTPYAKSNQLLLGQTISTLVTNLDIQPSVAGISLNILTPLLQVAGNLLRPLLTGLLDGLVGPVLDNLLAALGLELGNTRVWVTGARCGVPVLV